MLSLTNLKRLLHSFLKPLESTKIHTHTHTKYNSNYNAKMYYRSFISQYIKIYSHTSSVCVVCVRGFETNCTKSWGGSDRVLVKEVIAWYEGTASKGKEGQEGHSDRRTRHLREIVFSPVWNPVVNTSHCRGWGRYKHICKHLIPKNKENNSGTSMTESLSAMLYAKA